MRCAFSWVVAAFHGLCAALSVTRVEDARRLVREVSSKVKNEFPVGDSSRRHQRDKLARMATQLAKRLSTAAEAFTRKNKATKPPSAAVTGATAPRDGGADMEDALPGMEAIEVTDATDAELAKEREEEAAAIAREMAEIADVVKDLAVLVDDQHDDILKVESSAKSAEDAAKAGNKHLEGAQKSQQAYRRKLIMFVVVILLGAGAITAYFLLRGHH